MQKKPRNAGLFVFGLPFQSHIVDVMIQTAFMARGLVAMDQALVGHAVDCGHCVFVRSFCCRLVAFFNSVVNAFDVSTHHSAHAHVVGATVNGLAGAFSCSG